VPQIDDSEGQKTPSPLLRAVADNGPTPEPTSSMEVTEEDLEAEENLADDDISRYKAAMEKAQKGLEIAGERKKIIAGIKRGRVKHRADEEEEMKKLRRLSGHPSHLDQI
jgi:hypothetical protein